MFVAIVGSRNFKDLERVRKFVRELPLCTVVSGGARGVDSVATEEAQKCGLETIVYPADWEKYGKQAGFIRNRTIVERADKVVAFWDGKSAGTKHSIELAQKLDKDWEVYYE